MRKPLAHWLRVYVGLGLALMLGGVVAAIRLATSGLRWPITITGLPERLALAALVLGVVVLLGAVELVGLYLIDAFLTEPRPCQVCGAPSAAPMDTGLMRSLPLLVGLRRYTCLRCGATFLARLV